MVHIGGVGSRDDSVVFQVVAESGGDGVRSEVFADIVRMCNVMYMVVTNEVHGHIGYSGDMRSHQEIIQDVL